MTRHAAARGTAALAPPAVELYAPAPRSDMAPDEYRNWKQQAAHRLHTGGREVHYDSTPSPLAPGTGNSFNGLGQNGWIPYDAAIAIGPNHVVEMTNAQWAAYDRNGTQLTINQFAAWWGTPAGTPFDPKCFYDAAADRFVMIAVSVSSTQAFYHISVSQTGDPTGNWFNYQLNARLDGTTNTSNWSDFPQMGYDDSAVYISTNQFSLSSNFFQYAKIRVLKKAELYAGGAITYVDFIGMRNADNTLAFTLQPAQVLSPSTVGYFLNSRSSSGSNVTLWRMDSPTTSPSLVRQATVSVGSYVLPPDAAQPNTSTLVATNDARVLELAFRNGVLHGVFTESVGGVAAMRYLRINATTSALLKDISYTAPGVHYFFPAVSVDSADSVYFVMSRSSSSEFASLYHTGMMPADATIQPSALLKAGVSTNTTGRWGDYSGIAMDPANPFAVWAAGGWANTANRWATWNSQSTFGSTGTTPTLASINPNGGSPGQVLNNVQLAGTNFDPSPVINISGSGVTVSNTQLVSATQLTATFTLAGNAAAGGRSVTVTTSNGTSNAQTFTVAAVGPPTLGSITPDLMNPGKTVQATVAGTNFVAGNTMMSFTKGTGVTLQNLNVVSPTQYSVDVVLAANASLGGHFFTVTTPGGTSNSIFFDVLREPVINSLTPNAGTPGNSYNVTISGANFYNGATAQIAGSGVTLSNIVRLSNSTITATLDVAPGAASGPRDVTVVTLAGTSAPVPFMVNGPASPPTLSSVVPNNGNPGASVPVTLSGTNFDASATINVSGSGVTVSNPQFVNSTTLTATFVIAVAAAQGPRNVSVTTNAGTSNAVSFTVNPPPPPPVLNSVNPNNGDPGTNVPVTLSGSNFDASATISVSGSGVTVSNPQFVNSTTLTATLVIASNAAQGPRNVSVTTNWGTSGSVSFTVNPPPPQPPALNSLAPNNGLIGSTAPVTLNGANFDAGAGVNISGSGVSVQNVQFVSSAQLAAEFVIAGNAATGGRSVTVTTSNGTSNALTFTVNLPPPPTISSISPSPMNPGTITTATIAGTNFVAGATSIALTTGTGVTVQNVNVVSTTQLTADFVLAANASLGGHRFRGTTPAGTSNEIFFDVLRVPVINSLTPSAGTPGNSYNVTISGANFYNGATAQIAGSGVMLSNIVRLSNSTITATFTVAPGASPGPRDVIVVTLAGTSAPVPFTVQ